LNLPIIAIDVKLEQDVVLARQRARQIARLAGFPAQDQTRIATVVSEITRNAFQYAGGGRIELAIIEHPPMLEVKVEDRGPGIPQLEAVLEGTYRSETGLGLGLSGARRMMDGFDVQTSPKGTTVVLRRKLPERATSDLPKRVASLARDLANERPSTPLEELQRQNQELIATLGALEKERQHLAEVNRELEDTNRGVVALVAEIDERAGYLQRANELKTSFLSNMTHEFRTPLNSILSLSRMLLERLDGPLTAEQEKQVGFIKKAADGLCELVNDLLDLAKVEAGKILVKPARFQVSELFSALRGMLRPLLQHNASVALVIEDPDEDLELVSDEAKLSQILRNFISNALKFTEMGEVKVLARQDGPSVVFSVSDTGIGIAPEDQDRIFEEFAQLDTPIHQRTKGTGLGLPLSRRLATLLGGSIHVKSTVGTGSTFSLIVPRILDVEAEVAIVPDVSRTLDPTRAPVLIVEDNREALFIYQKYLAGTRYQPLSARTTNEAEAWLRAVRPVAIVCDVLLERETTWRFIDTLKREEATKNIPLLVVTMVENERRVRSLGAEGFALKPIDRAWLVGSLDRLTKEKPQRRALVIDDDEISRYLLRGLLSELAFVVFESPGGPKGIPLAEAVDPDVVFLDLAMPEMSGFEVLNALKSKRETARIPVVVYTAALLHDADRARLAAASAIVPKESGSREAALASLRRGLVAAGVGGVEA
jgi:signal transduction histidine kinase/CheY-like chemotaxis protein